MAGAASPLSLSKKDARSLNTPVRRSQTPKPGAGLTGECSAFVRSTIAGVSTEAAVETALTTSTTPVPQTPSCKSSTITFSSLPCATSKPAKRSLSITNRHFTRTISVASAAPALVAARSIVSENPCKSVFQSRGNVKLNFDPRPSSESSSTRPPCCSTTSRTNDNPKPVDSSSFSCPSRTTR